MKPTKFCCGLLGAAILLTTSQLQASMTVHLTADGGNANSGGLFKAYTTGNGTFDTFCLSIPTGFAYNTTYNYNISSTIDAVGVPPAPSYISLGTAYIYNQFNLGNSVYGGTKVGATLDAVQAAIWFLQGDLIGMIDPENNVDLSALISPLLTQLETDSGHTLTELQADGGSMYNVYAMNMYNITPNGNGSVAQPQLYQAQSVPEPSTIVAGALLLLPFGVSTLRILRKSKMQ